MLLDRYSQKAKAKYAKEINERCNSALASAARTEAIIAEERANYENIPEEYRDQFLAKYDELENKVKAIRADVERIRQSFECEVMCNATE
jgi:hypothetical protein